MAQVFWQALLAMPTALGATAAVSMSAIATEVASPLPVSNVEQDSVQVAQITGVDELSDVFPSDWAYTALQNLVNTYGCIEGYPNRTFRGNQPLTRYEFAAGLNACLDVISQLIGVGGVEGTDLSAIQRLQQEFTAELATLRGRVDALEAQTAQLRAQQFSTTTRLRGQVDFHLVAPFDVLGDRGANSETSTSVASRIRLNFDSSFTGRDRLRIRLQAGNGNALAPFTGLQNARGANFNVTIDDFYYQFPVGNRIQAVVAARGLQGDDFVTNTIVPFDGVSVAQAGEPSFYNIGGSSSDGVGFGLNIKLTDTLLLDAGYTAGNAGAAQPSVGLFAAANQSYIVQLSYLGEGFLQAGVAYLHNDRSNTFALNSTGVAAPTGGTDTYAGLLKLDFGSFFISGHGAFSSFNGGDDFSWTAGIGFDDFLVEGSKLGIYGGQLPQLVGRSSNPVLIEGYYEIPVNRFLTVTPALIYGEANQVGPTDNTGFWGVVRTTFRF